MKNDILARNRVPVGEEALSQSSEAACSGTGIQNRRAALQTPNVQGPGRGKRETYSLVK